MSSLAGTTPFVCVTVPWGGVAAGAPVACTVTGNGPAIPGAKRAGTRVYVPNYYDSTVSVIDTASNTAPAQTSSLLIESHRPHGWRACAKAATWTRTERDQAGLRRGQLVAGTRHQPAARRGRYTR